MNTSASLISVRNNMDFVAFAAEHGLLITHLISGRWVRCATTDKPGAKKNGSYIYSGDSGAIQNWAVHERPICWRDEHAVVDRDAMRRNIQKSQEDKKLRQDKAAKKAGWIMHNAVCDHHPYLKAKGLPNEKGWVWQGKLVVPMRIGGNLVGCQLIDAEGEKKFLYGQQTKGAIAQISSKGQTILCEGYATALSVKAALKYAGVRYNIIICFSAGNMIEVAAQYPDCLVIADHDVSQTGQKAAKKIGRPAWISPIVGEDFNDYHRRVGTEEASLVLTAMM
jgi:putative DNA primase/helicase